jgi:hypothetical protein
MDGYISGDVECVPELVLSLLILIKTVLIRMIMMMTMEAEVSIVWHCNIEEIPSRLLYVVAQVSVHA